MHNSMDLSYTVYQNGYPHLTVFFKTNAHKDINVTRMHAHQNIYEFEKLIYFAHSWVEAKEILPNLKLKLLKEIQKINNTIPTQKTSPTYINHNPKLFSRLFETNFKHVPNSKSLIAQISEPKEEEYKLHNPKKFLHLMQKRKIANLISQQHKKASPRLRIDISKTDAFTHSYYKCSTPSPVRLELPKPTFFNTHLYTLTGAITSLITAAGCGFWLLNNNYIGLQLALMIGTIAFIVSSLSGMYLDDKNRNVLSLLGNYPFMTLSLEISSILSSVCSIFLIVTNLVALFPATVITLMFITLSSLSGIVYDVQIEPKLK